MTVPSIVIPNATMPIRLAEGLRDLLSTAAERLDAIMAWPSHSAGIQIQVLNAGICRPGTEDHKTMVVAMRSANDIDDRAPVGTLQRTPGSPMEIDVSIDLFVGEIGKRLTDLGATPPEVCFHFLAHEIHHLTEVERMASCGIQYGNHLTAMAGAARPDFPADWKRALALFTKRHPVERSLSLELKAAGAIANEASADLFGLHCMREAALPWEKFADRLIQLRRSDWENSQKPTRALSHYPIAETLETIILAGLPDAQRIYSRCWDLAIAKALEAKDLSLDVADAFRSLGPLQLPLLSHGGAPSKHRPLSGPS